MSCRTLHNAPTGSDKTMEYTKLGRTGLDVSRICLGCMSYGGGNLGNHAWSLPEEESRPFIKKALEAGIKASRTHSGSGGSSWRSEPTGDVGRKRVRSDLGD